MRDILDIESDIVVELRTVFDPEVPVNVYDLGLIYDVDVQDDGKVDITMTLTAPNCPVADDVVQEVKTAVGSVEGVTGVEVKLVFDPPWDQSRMSEEAKLDLGLL
ncbi:MAG: FeS assembly SUF system protein [Candidatus [Bacteroides] periocalifornicus]|jgi:FeS assembly SUF system protein|uniref:FeS assembly SUF system protein n=1 Tax=Candidatus [Bacteroides] periocalifornicus TaxID=1702214 RepID=A0A0Q4B9R8_9BACT|nr:MAG: FeS assembly SUF system protein [Candidatus [Bacteroides] periocalifornicus]